MYDHNGGPYPNIPLQLLVDTEGPWGPNLCVETGTTDDQGYCYLECLVDPNYSEQLNFMQVTITANYYAIIKSENTTTTTESFIFPVFDIGIDYNYNDVVDVWEMPLAQKFCPYLKLHHQDAGVRSVPVEIMDRNGDGTLWRKDVSVTCFNFFDSF